ncbi:MAG TPA: hypothetical protein VNJ08_08610 [Bacteriovoracaceae bacterium]|nr:hypothetical protein [Bacteriovoracaceae bacterium]
MKNKQNIIMGLGAIALLAAGAFISWTIGQSGKHAGSLSDRALLALIKNDQSAFEGFIADGGNMQAELPLIDGKTYTVAEGLSYFDRANFVKFLQAKKMPFIVSKKGRAYDVLSLSIPKNNPELLDLYLLEKPDLMGIYGDKQWGLLHMASALCSHKLTAILHQKGKLNWDMKAKDGSTPLTLAAEYDCLPVLSYWKEQKADFKARDGRGLTALSILRKKKDAALVAFADSFEVRLPAAVAVVKEKPELDFYKKRKIPKDQKVDHAALIEPEDRPIEAVETADFSEFSD